MRTNIFIDDSLMQEALRLTGLTTKREVVELALKTLIERRRQGSITTQSLSAKESKPAPTDISSGMIRLGMFSAGNRKPSTEEDFKIAEFHGDDDDGLD